MSGHGESTGQIIQSLVVNLLIAAVKAWQFFVDIANSVLDRLGGFGDLLRELGVNLIKGLAGGILSGGGFVFDAVA